MSYLLNIFFILFLKFILIITTQVKANKGLTDIFYNSTSKILFFKIPLEENCDKDSLILNLSYPYRSNRTYCSSNCNINRINTSNIFYECEIKKEECDLLEGNKKIIIDSISEPSDCEFENPNYMISVINFEQSSVDMACANYKLSFFIHDNKLLYYPYDNIFFNFPIYYKDKMETAECLFPKNINQKRIACTIDASNRTFEKGYFVNFEYNKSIALTKDLNLTLNLEKYVLEDDCGKTINKERMILFQVYNYIIILFLFILYI